MTAKASSTDSAVPFSARPTLSVVGREPTRAAEHPLRPWSSLGDGRYACPLDETHPERLAILSPLPDHQAVRLLEVDGQFHILTGRVADDAAMQVVAEDVIAGF